MTNVSNQTLFRKVEKSITRWVNRHPRITFFGPSMLTGVALYEVVHNPNVSPLILFPLVVAAFYSVGWGHRGLNRREIVRGYLDQARKEVASFADPSTPSLGKPTDSNARIKARKIFANRPKSSNRRMMRKMNTDIT